MKKSIGSVFLTFLFLTVLLSACSSPTATPQQPTATPQPPTATLTATPTSAPPLPIKTSVEGKVYRSDKGQPNADVDIALYDSKVTLKDLPSSKPIYETTTNSEGQYKFEDVLEGSYQVLISLQGSDPSLSTCTKTPNAGSEWIFYSLSYDRAGHLAKIQYMTVNSFKIAAGDNLRKDFSWICK